MALIQHQDRGMLTNMSEHARSELRKLDGEEWEDLMDEVVDDLDLPCPTDIMAEEDTTDMGAVETVKDLVFTNRSPDFHKMLADIEKVTAPFAARPPAACPVSVA
eukprot:gene16745-18746_t